MLLHHFLLTLSSMLVTMDLLPNDGRLAHLIWSLIFLKQYTGQKLFVH